MSFVFLVLIERPPNDRNDILCVYMIVWQCLENSNLGLCLLHWHGCFEVHPLQGSSESTVTDNNYHGACRGDHSIHTT